MTLALPMPAALGVSPPTNADPLARAREVLDEALNEVLPLWESNPAVVQLAGAMGFDGVLGFVKAFQTSAPYQELLQTVREAIEAKRSAEMPEPELMEALPELIADPVKDRERIRANIAALELVLSIERRGTPASDKERKVLDSYTGWGGLSSAIGTVDLAQLGASEATIAELGKAGLDEYYTPSEITSAVARIVAPLAKKLYKDRQKALGSSEFALLALEPSAGIGRFIRDATKASGVPMSWTAVELSELSFRILRALGYSDNLTNDYFEAWTRTFDGTTPPTPIPQFDLVLSNPPYLEPRGAPQKIDLSSISFEENKASNYFLRRCLEALAPDGVGCFLIPSGFMSSGSKKFRELRQKVLRDFYLVDAWRMPSDIFPGASVVTDLIVFVSMGAEADGTAIKGRFSGFVDPAEASRSDAGRARVQAEINAEKHRMARIIDGRYFEDRPAHVLGREFLGSRSYERDVTGMTREERLQVEVAIKEKIKAEGKLVSRRATEYVVKGNLSALKKVKLSWSGVPGSFMIEPRPPVERASKRSIFVGVNLSTTALPAEVAQACNLGARVSEFLQALSLRSSRARDFWPKLREDLETWRIGADPRNDELQSAYFTELGKHMRSVDLRESWRARYDEAERVNTGAGPSVAGPEPLIEPRPKEPKLHEVNPYKLPSILEARDGVQGYLIEAFLEAYEPNGKVREVDLDIIGVEADDLAPAPEDVLAQAALLFRQRLILTLPELEYYHLAIGGMMNADQLKERLFREGWAIFGDDFERIEPTDQAPGFEVDYFYTGYLWSKIDQCAARLGDEGLDGEAARVQHAELLRRGNFTTYAQGAGFDVTIKDGWVPVEAIQDWINARVQQDHRPIELQRGEYGRVILWDSPQSSYYDRRLSGQEGDQPYGAREFAKAPEIPDHLRYGRENERDILGDLRDIWGYINGDNEVFKPIQRKVMVQRRDGFGKKMFKVDPYTGEQVADMEDKTPDIWQVRHEKAAAWNKDFNQWLATQTGEDGPDYVSQVENNYNRVFRGFVEPVFDGSPLSVARWRSRDQGGVDLKGHQNQGVRFVTAGRGGLLAFDVGVGKTYTSIATTALGLQEGWIRKPLFVIPNTIVWKWYEDFAKVAPSLRVIVIGSDRRVMTRGPKKGQVVADIEGSSPGSPPGDVVRGRKWRAFQRGEYDVAIITYSMLDRTAMSRASLVSYVEHTPQLMAEFKDAEALARQTQEKAGAVMKKGKELSKKLKQDLSRANMIQKEGIIGWLDTKLSIGGDIKLDEGILFDQIGIDWVVVDEAQNFKNLYLAKPRGKSGVPKFMGASAPSLRAWQLEFRSAIIRRTYLELHGRRGGVMLLSATPAKNSPLELYNLVQMIDHNAFSEMDIWSSEQFIDRFCDIEARTSINSSTQEPEEKQTLVGFKNIGEMRSILKRFGMFRSASDLPELAASLPKQGEPVLEEILMNQAQESLYDWLRAELKKEIDEAKSDKRAPNVLGFLASMSQTALHPFLSWLKGPLEVVLDEDKKPVITNGVPEVKAVTLTAVERWNMASRETPWEPYVDRKGVLIDPNAGYEDVPRPAIDEWGRIIPNEWQTGRPYFPEYTWACPKLLTCLVNIGRFRDLASCDPKTPDTACGPTTCGHIIFVENIGVHVWLLKLLERGFYYVEQERREYDMRLDSPNAGQPTGRMLPAGVRRPLPGDPKSAIKFFPPYPAERIGVLNSIKAPTPQDRLQIAKDFNGTDEQPPSLDIVIANQVAYEGIDLQRQTCMIHHLDLPWEPATYQQRNGRGVRQGNLQTNIYIVNYFSAFSFDATRFQLIVGKAGWVNLILAMPEGDAAAAKVINNPAASSEFSDPAYIAMLIARTPEEGIALGRKFREVSAQKLRDAIVGKAATGIRKAEAAFVKMRNQTSAEGAATLRAEGENALALLESIDSSVEYGWPYFMETKAALLRGPVFIDRRARPLAQGLRVKLNQDGGGTAIFECGRIVVSSKGRTMFVRVLGSSLEKLRTRSQSPFFLLPEYTVNEGLVEGEPDDAQDDIGLTFQLFMEEAQKRSHNATAYSDSQRDARREFMQMLLWQAEGVVEAAFAEPRLSSLIAHMASTAENEPLSLGAPREPYYVPGLIDGVLVGLHGRAVKEHWNHVIVPTSEGWKAFVEAYAAERPLPDMAVQYWDKEKARPSDEGYLLPLHYNERQRSGEPIPYTAAQLIARQWFGQHLTVTWRAQKKKNPLLFIGNPLPNPLLFVGNPPTVERIAETCPCPPRRGNPRGNLQSVMVHQKPGVSSRAQAGRVARMIVPKASLKDHHKTAGGWRFRQQPPESCEPGSYGSKLILSRDGSKKAVLSYCDPDPLKQVNPRLNQPGREALDEVDEADDGSFRSAWEATVGRYGEWGEPDHVVPVEIPPAASKFMAPIGELVQIEYAAADNGERKIIRFYHPAGDHGPGKKKTKPPILAYDAENRWIHFAKPEGCEFDFSDRGIVG